MREYFDQTEFEEIKKLFEAAISAPNKAEAQKSITQLEYMGDDVTGYSHNVFCELIAYIKGASGKIRDKEWNVNNATSQLWKFKMHCVK